MVVEDLEEVFGWSNGTKMLKGKLWELELGVELIKKVR